MAARHSKAGAVSAAAVIMAAGGGAAWADPIGSEFIPAELAGSDVSFNILWIVLGAALVIFMQAGFALVETGFCRAKHAAHVVSTNFAIFGLGLAAYFLVGFGLMFGAYSATIGADAVPVIGAYTEPIGRFIVSIPGLGGLIAWATPGLGGAGYDVGVLAFFLYLTAFMDTTATIPTGAMAERWRWNAFVGWALFCGAIYFPLFGAWTWGGGWLSQLGNTFGLGKGYVDFAGSGVVHAMGGMAALAGALVLGPRLGKFAPDGRPRALPGHHVPMAMLGTLILLFGWFGFNAASTFAATDPRLAVVAANTAIAAGFGATAAMLYAQRRLGKPDPSMMANGMLAGLVAITAPCAFVQPWAAALIGVVAGVVVIESILFVERRLRVDDPVGAVSVHGVNGLWGLIALGIFADGSYGAGWNATGNAIAEPVSTGVTGILYGDAGQLGAQLIGVLILGTVMFGIAYAFFTLQDRLSRAGIRSDEADEITGLDLPEMGVLAYPEFVSLTPAPATPASTAVGPADAVDLDLRVERRHRTVAGPAPRRRLESEDVDA